MLLEVAARQAICQRGHALVAVVVAVDVQRPKMVTNWQGGGGGKAAKSAEYGRSYPVRTEEPVRREGATGPERPKRMRPDGAVCYVEGKNGGLGVKRRHVQQGEQPGRPPGRPPEG